MKCDIINLDANTVGSIELSEAVFAVPVRGDLLERTVRWQLAKRQRGTHSTRTIAFIRGTTKKPYKQKGSGQARQGSLRSPQFRGGAVIFGPTPRSHEHDLPKKVRKLALKTALSSKAASGKLIIVDALSLSAPKTKELAGKLSKLGWKNALIVDGADVNEGFARAARNIPNIDVLPSLGANVYDILRRDTLVLTKDAVSALEARLK